MPRWLILYLGAALIFLCLRSRLDKLDWWALALFFYMCLSLLWSFDPGAGAYEMTNAGTLLIIFLWARHAPKAHLAYVPEGLIIAVGFALFLQWLWPHDTGGHGNTTFQSEVLLVALYLSWLATDIRQTSTWLYVVLAPPVFMATMIYLVAFNVSKVEWFVAVFWIGIWIMRWLIRVVQNVWKTLLRGAGAASVG